LSFSELRAPFVIRLDEQGRWFAGSQDTSERRIGWRMAIGGFLRFRETELCVVSVHLESSTDKWDRQRQMQRLFKQLARQTDGRPVIIGGDLNTSSLPPANGSTHDWFECPEQYEPLFEFAQRHGYEWRTFNLNLPTERTRPDGTPAPPFRKIDWFLTSGLRGSDPETIPALSLAGNAISDHDVILVTCTIKRSGLSNGC
jgi:endonuclease/exonuclease/phosphatase family metal-dependent hydrolase